MSSIMAVLNNSCEVAIYDDDSAGVHGAIGMIAEFTPDAGNLAIKYAESNGYVLQSVSTGVRFLRFYHSQRESDGPLDITIFDDGLVFIGVKQFGNGPEAIDAAKKLVERSGYTEEVQLEYPSPEELDSA